MKNLNNLIFAVLVVFFAACGTAQKEAEQTKPEQNAVEQESAPQAEAEQEAAKPVQEEAEEPKGQEEPTNYDGLRYVGPSITDFVEGWQKYASEGCEAANKSWSAAFEKDPKNAQIAFNIAVCFARLKKVDESRIWYEKAYSLEPDTTKPLYNLALSYGDDLKNQQSRLLELVEKTTDVVEKNNFVAWVYLQVGNLPEAEKHAKMVLKEDEQNSEAVISLATSYFHKGMYELAASALDTAEKWDPDNFRLHRIYGFLLYKMEDTKGAQSHLLKAVKNNPDLPEVRNILAVLAMKIEDFATAKEQLEQALRINSDFLSAKLNLALAYKGLEEYKKSDEILTELEAIEDLPADLKKGVLFNKGLLHLDADVEGKQDPNHFVVAVNYFNSYLKLIAKDKNYKAEKELVDGYIKEAGVEKKKLEFALAAKAKAEKKRKAQEEEARLYKEHKEAAFKAAEEANTVEAWQKFVDEYPSTGEDDELGNTAKSRLDAMKPAEPAPEAQPAEQPSEAAPSEAQPVEQPAEQPAQETTSEVQPAEQPAAEGQNG
ncbi:tetratricopeptide repeat protein [bacterium]|nr:tetratricopeptide repeat protein [bacterium]